MAFVGPLLAALVAQAIPGALQATLPVAPAPSRTRVPGQAAPPPPRPSPLCAGDYADALPIERASAILDTGKEPFVWAIRNTATYEHVYYGRDGKLHRSYLRSTVHGTGFGWRAVNGETQIVTNEHVASQPDVTDEEHGVDGIPPGSRKVREQLRIVRDENDDYEPGHVPLTKVLSDPAADIAVLKARKTLPVLPWRIGRSGALRPGNLVQVRGFPLGAFPALNTGKVLNPFTADSEKGWNHADFVVDALLNAGNSGSPVFAVSCHTGEPELVGVYHAGYTDAAALNAVISIDQLREELETLKVPRREGALHAEVTAQDRDGLVKLLFGEPTRSLTFPYGGRSVVVQLVDPGTLRFSILDEDFPLTMREQMALVDRAAQNGFGTLDGVGVQVDGQPVEAPAQSLDADVRERFDRLYESLWRQLLAVVDYRGRLARGTLSAEAFAEAQQARNRLRKHGQEQKELLGLCAFEADRASFGAARSAQAAAPAPRDGGPAQAHDGGQPAPHDGAAPRPPQDPSPPASAAK